MLEVRVCVLCPEGSHRYTRSSVETAGIDVIAFIGEACVLSGPRNHEDAIWDKLNWKCYSGDPWNIEQTEIQGLQAHNTAVTATITSISCMYFWD